jgi:hypothetical protein
MVENCSFYKYIETVYWKLIGRKRFILQQDPVCNRDWTFPGNKKPLLEFWCRSEENAAGFSDNGRQALVDILYTSTTHICF